MLTCSKEAFAESVAWLAGRRGLFSFSSDIIKETALYGSESSWRRPYMVVGTETIFGVSVGVKPEIVCKCHIVHTHLCTVSVSNGGCKELTWQTSLPQQHDCTKKCLL
ncbi:hypothetical protein BaRGS_00026796 [Batillaria attramentaria]|uniref:Uncharacterized protein n=1 Tax=Batillaria attramentaria TaxID=370345 RepID=A0ABD0K552_9CAEN